MLVTEAGLALDRSRAGARRSTGCCCGRQSPSRSPSRAASSALTAGARLSSLSRRSRLAGLVRPRHAAAARRRTAARTCLGRLGDGYYLVVGVLAVVGWWSLRRARRGRVARDRAHRSSSGSGIFTAHLRRSAFSPRADAARVPAPAVTITHGADVRARRERCGTRRDLSPGRDASSSHARRAVALVVALANVATLALVETSHACAISRLVDGCAPTSTPSRHAPARPPPALVHVPFDLHATPVAARVRGARVAAYADRRGRRDAAARAPGRVRSSAGRRGPGEPWPPGSPVRRSSPRSASRSSSHRLESLDTVLGGGHDRPRERPRRRGRMARRRPRLVALTGGRTRARDRCAAVTIAGWPSRCSARSPRVLQASTRRRAPRAAAGGTRTSCSCRSTRCAPTISGSYGYARDTSPTHRRARRRRRALHDRDLTDVVDAAGARDAADRAAARGARRRRDGPPARPRASSRSPRCCAARLRDRRLRLGSVPRRRLRLRARLRPLRRLQRGRASRVPRGAPRPHLARAARPAATRWLERLGRPRRPARPFFVFLHMWDVHYDFNPPPPYDTHVRPRLSRARHRRRLRDRQISVHAGMDPRDLAHVVALYDGEIRYTDEYLGRLIDVARRSAAASTTRSSSSPPTTARSSSSTARRATTTRSTTRASACR